MLFNNVNYLLLEKRGCNFFPGDRINELSDVGNYRVGAYWDDIPGKDGRNYTLEFTNWDRKIWLYKNKRTRQGDVYMSPIEWWINTGRASTPFLKAFCKADYHSIGRILEKGGADQEVVKKLLRLFHLDV